MQSRDYQDPVTIYRRELESIQPLTNDEQLELFRQLDGSGEWNDHQKDVARRIFESQLYQVVNIAEGYSSSDIQILDLVQEGNLGLYSAVERFARQPSGDFSAFAAGVIRDWIAAFVNKSR